jgi:xylose dehydrogenase (NAD/NADP)
MSAVQWGMLSTAGIGRMVASAVQGSVNTRFAAVASRDAAKARGFAAEFGLPLSFGSYQDLLACPEVDAVYVPLPVSMHTEWTVRALNAGKHVLCEKPFAMTAADAGRCFDVAEAANRLVIEGLMWREHPQTAVAMHLVAEGAVGRLALVRAALSVSARRATSGGPAFSAAGPSWIWAATASARSGCSAASRSRCGRSRCPTRPRCAGCDLRLAATLTLPDDVLGQFDVGLDLTRRDELELIGTKGKVVVPDPWLCRTGRLELHSGAKAEYLAADPDGRVRAWPGRRRRVPHRAGRRLPGDRGGDPATLRQGGRGGAGGSDRDGAAGCSRRRRSRCTGRDRPRRHIWAGQRVRRREGSPMTSSARAGSRLRQPGAESRLTRDRERRRRADRYFPSPA